MEKTLLLCLALLLPVNIHSENNGRYFFGTFSIMIVGVFSMMITDIVCKSIKIAEKEKTQQEKEKTQQEKEKTKQLNLTIAIKNRLANKE